MRRPIKICENPECGDDILEYISAKREFCDEKCRKRAWYINNKVEYKEHIDWIRAIKQQLKIVELFVLKDKFEVHASTLKDLGLDMDLWRTPKYDKNMIPTYRIGKYELHYNKESKIITIKIKKDETKH
jgi:hypothetical protein